MLDLARKYNRPVRVAYTPSTPMATFAFNANHFDFIYSRLVLQHLRPRQTRQYVREFLRVLRPSVCCVSNCRRGAGIGPSYTGSVCAGFSRLREGSSTCAA